MRKNDEEVSHYAANGVLVSNRRFVVGAHTYAVQNINAIKHFRAPPKRTGPVCIILLGLFLGQAFRTSGDQVGSSATALIACALVLSGAIILFRQKTTYSIRLLTTSGEVAAYTSHDKNQVAAIVAALNKALLLADNGRISAGDGVGTVGRKKDLIDPNRPERRGNSMSDNKKTVVICVIIAGCLMGLFPPWTETFKYQSMHSQKPAGYSFIFTPPNPCGDTPTCGVLLDVRRLFVQWAALGGIGVVAWMLTRD